MPRKITRRPFTDCPYRWSLNVAGISGGEGTVSEAQCENLAGTYNLDWKSCLSSASRLVWETDCEFSRKLANCGCPKCEACAESPPIPSTIISGSDVNGCPIQAYNQTQPGDSGFREYCPEGAPMDKYISIVRCQPVGGTEKVFCTNEHNADEFLHLFQIGVFNCQDCTGQVGCPPADPPPGLTGPETHDATRGKFRLEYDIPTTKFTLHSFERITTPKWSLIDPTPCVGNTKTLTLDPVGSAVNGCFVAQHEVTITRTCGPDRPAREHKRSKQNGQLRRPGGCACDDEVNDLRGGCPKCVSTDTLGCTTYSADQIACKYPKGSDCCDYCPEDTAPCAYIAEFECDISYHGIKIAAKQVTLRHKCYFENSCDWVAPGPEIATGGSPGAQPICASCSGNCPATGCSWDAWVVATCPRPCGANVCNTSVTYTASVGVFTSRIGCDTIADVTTAENIVLTYNPASDRWEGSGTQGTSLYMDMQANCLHLVATRGAAPCPAMFLWFYEPIPQISTCDNTIVFHFDHSQIRNGFSSSDLYGAPMSITVAKN